MQVDNVSVNTQVTSNQEFIKQFTSAGKQTLSNDNHKEQQEFSKKDVETAVEQLNEITETLDTRLKFAYHEELNEYYVTVIDPLTDEVIKEIPPKKMLDMYAAMVGFVGILIDEKI
ncbi:MAG TPA: flagellar protein FlaG [Bacillota bacterium]|nr:flagellar protein FlaG [Bacillota bacterium]